MLRLTVVLVLLAVLAPAATAGGPTYAAAGSEATQSLLTAFYAGNGTWRSCNDAACATGNRDWGDDALTYALALRYRLTRDASLLPTLAALSATAPTYPAPCSAAASCDGWSDVPAWDAIAAADEYAATGDAAVLAKAEAAYAYVEQSHAYALGACPSIDYQQPDGGANRLKTLETDANLIKAALLLYDATHEGAYLAQARAHYAAVRTWFLDPHLPLYSVYVFDDGSRCRQLPHRFFASVNGDMIWAGVRLAADTGVLAYRTQALATAHAVATQLADGAGVFADLQAENDVAEPLVEGMLAAGQRAWLLANASAALAARSSDGAFGRFWDGPAPAAPVTAWQANGGYALETAAASLAPGGVAQPRPWRAPIVRVVAITQLPATIRFRGSAIAVLGTLGEHCCEDGHARVLVDGAETVDHTGIWQDKSSSGRSLPGTVIFAWRWRTAGRHTLTFLPGVPNAKEGGSFLDVSQYELLR